jgi:hypothetical protein
MIRKAEERGGEAIYEESKKRPRWFSTSPTSHTTGDSRLSSRENVVNGKHGTGGGQI